MAYLIDLKRRLYQCLTHAFCADILLARVFGHNTLRRHLHLLLLDSPLCRRCGGKGAISAHILCECEALASLRHAYLGSFFLEPEDIKSISLRAIWNFSKVTGLP
jgi:hypothetical protein